MNKRIDFAFAIVNVSEGTIRIEDNFVLPDYHEILIQKGLIEFTNNSCKVTGIERAPIPVDSERIVERKYLTPMEVELIQPESVKYGFGDIFDFFKGIKRPYVEYEYYIKDSWNKKIEVEFVSRPVTIIKSTK